MLSAIIASYLNISEVQAEHLVKLVSHEQQWSEEQQLKVKAKEDPSKEVVLTFKLAEAEKQEDVINFLQALGQSKWFKGHDRSQFADTNTNENDTYYSIFTGLGLTQAAPFDSSNGEPAFSAVLGSSESQVRTRLIALEADLRAGHGPRMGIVYGLAGNRALGTGVMESEQYSKDMLTANNDPLTEANMVDLIVSEKLIALEMEDSKFSFYSFKGINTAGVGDRAQKDCVKTGDTAVTLKDAIEQSYQTSILQKPIVVAVYSNQPFVLRQARDVQLKLGDDYKVIGVGTELSRENLDKNPKAVTIIEGEVARLININYTPKNLRRFDVSLTAEEKAELKTLISESAKKRANAAIKNIDNVTTLFAAPTNKSASTSATATTAPVLATATARK